MILDSSAILSVMLAERGHERIVRCVTESPVVGIGAPTMVEAAIVLSSRLRHDARPLINEFLREADVQIISFTREHYEVALDAFNRFGKGRHPAGLNFGDCLTYAVARISGMPLLFSGDDFSKTDIARAD